MYIRNKSGPMTLPCGTLDRTRSPSIRLQEWDLTPSTRTLCVRPNRNSEIQLEVLPSMPYRRSFCMSLWWGTTSKALEKSSMLTSTSSLLSSLDSRSWEVIRSCDSQLSFFQNLCWYGERALYLSRWLRMWLHRTCSNNLHATQVKLTGR